MKFYINGSEIPLHIAKFPAGESLVRILDSATYNNNEKWWLNQPPMVVKMDFKSNDDIINLLLLTDAVRRKYGNERKLTLICHYFPYARQDRVCNPGESLSVKVIADLINGLNFDRVVVKDLHSDASGALIDNLDHISQTSSAMNLMLHMPPGVILVSPDAGANKKSFDIAKQYGIIRVLRADKMRETSTGKILETKVYGETRGMLENADMLICDDICEGGRTFIELGKVLKPMTSGKLHLYVTHGIFSKGVDELAQYFSGIYTSNLMGKEDKRITVI